MSNAPTPSRRAVGSLLGAPFDPQTYRNLLYLLVAIPLALLYFVVLSAGVSFTAGLSLTLLGPVALLATALATLALSRVDARLTDRLLGVDLSGPSFPADTGGAVAYAVELVTSRDAWVGAVYLCWRCVFGLAALLLLTTGVSLAAGLLAAPLAYGEFLVVNYRLGVWSVDTLPRALVAAGVGLLVAYATLMSVNLLVRASRAVAARLFGRTDERSGTPATTDG